MTKWIFKAIQNKGSEHCNKKKKMKIHGESFQCMTLGSLFSEVPWCSHINQPDKNL